MRRFLGVLAVGSLCLAASGASAHAAPGDLDPRFGDGGKVRTAITYELPTLEGAEATAVQDDGKLVVVGTSTGKRGFVVARYNPDGALDSSFGGDGKVTVGFGPDSWARVSDVAIQDDGRIVIAGGRTSSDDFEIARLTPGGALDESFAGDGRQTTDFGGSEYAAALVIQEDGNLVVAGNTYEDDDGSEGAAVARYNRDGSLDPSFDGDGVRVVESYGALTQAVAVHGDGRIVLGGCSGCGQQTYESASLMLIRLSRGGALDQSFSGDGVLVEGCTYPPGDCYEAAEAIAVQGDDKIIVARDDYKTNFLLRYMPDGTRDPSFSDDGEVAVPMAWVTGLAVEPDQRIVISGHLVGSDGFALARYDAGGSPDETFSGDGLATTDFPGSDWASGGVAVAPGGRLVAAGFTEHGDPADRDIAVAAFTNAGEPDDSFSDDGRVRTGFGIQRVDSHATAVDGALQEDGRIVVLGQLDVPSGRAPAYVLIRYKRDGSLDATFADDGILIDRGAPFHSVGGLAIQPNGKIVVGLVAHGSDPALVRYNPDGTRDQSFSGDGLAVADSLKYVARWIPELQADGKILMVGESRPWTVTRFDSAGGLDSGFGDDGWLVSDGEPDVHPVDAVTQGAGLDEEIVVGGDTSGRDFGLFRLSTAGEIDRGFGRDGLVRTRFGPGASQANAISLVAGGALVAAGFAWDRSDKTRIAVAKYKRSGAPDPRFSTDGKLTTGFGESSKANAIAVDSTGDLIVGGYVRDQGHDFALARYQADGKLDPAFGNGGRLTTEFAGQDGEIRALELQRGKLIAIGSSGGNFALARYESEPAR